MRNGEEKKLKEAFSYICSRQGMALNKESLVKSKINLQKRNKQVALYSIYCSKLKISCITNKKNLWFFFPQKIITEKFFTSRESYKTRFI